MICPSSRTSWNAKTRSVPPDCPDEWEYKDHTGYDPSEIRAIAAVSIRRLYMLPRQEQVGELTDLRPYHMRFFRDLTPDHCPYFAGHYRGEDYLCLQARRVGVAGDPRVGVAPHLVLQAMYFDQQQTVRAIAELDFVEANPSVYARQAVLIRMIKLAVALFVRFLEVHPFVNGNGHMGRLLLSGIMSRYGIRLSRFPIHDRPHRNYGELIRRYRNGITGDLESFVIGCI